MGERTAFFYGTLMSKHVLHRVIFGTANISKDPEALVLAAKISIQDAILHDHCRYHVQFADYPGMVPEKGQSVRGTYVAGLTDDNIKFLDWFEGTEYIKAKVKPFLLRPDSEGVLREDAEVDAETYIFVGGEERLDKKEWSFDVFVKEKLQNWADHSTEYAEVDANANAKTDDGHDPTGGRGIRGDLMDRVEEADDEELKSAV